MRAYLSSCITGKSLTQIEPHSEHTYFNEERELRIINLKALREELGFHSPPPPTTRLHSSSDSSTFNCDSSTLVCVFRIDQLIECNTRNILLEESCAKYGGETNLTPNLQFVFIACPSEGLSKYIETKLQATCIYLIQSFLENKKSSGSSLPASFSA